MFIKNKFCNNYFRPFDVDDNSDSDLWMLTLRTPDLVALLLLTDSPCEVQWYRSTAAGAKDVQPSGTRCCHSHWCQNGIHQTHEAKRKRTSKTRTDHNNEHAGKGKRFMGHHVCLFKFICHCVFGEPFPAVPDKQLLATKNRFASLNRSLITQTFSIEKPAILSSAQIIQNLELTSLPWSTILPDCNFVCNKLLRYIAIFIWWT